MDFCFVDHKPRYAEIGVIGTPLSRVQPVQHRDVTGWNGLALEIQKRSQSVLDLSDSVCWLPCIGASIVEGNRRSPPF